jgi:hypothetical protein
MDLVAKAAGHVHPFSWRESCRASFFLSGIVAASTISWRDCSRLDAVRGWARVRTLNVEACMIIYIYSDVIYH